MPTATESFALPHGLVEVAWRRSSRARRVSLRIDPRAGHIIVTLPPRIGRAAGCVLLRSHADWINQRLSRLPDAAPFQAGFMLRLHGAPVLIRHDPARRGLPVLEGDALHVPGDPAFLARRTTDFLRREAARTLGALAADKAGGAGLRVRRLAIKDTRTRWGSCTAQGTLMFNWRLVMAPPFVQDYVVAHEVAHLRHMNHGAAFWALVDALSQHRPAAIGWLMREGAALMRAGWAEPAASCGT